MKWILATGVLVAVGAIAVAWYRGGEDTATAGEPLVLGERRHRVIPADGDGAPLLVLLHERGGSPRELLWPELLDSLEALGPDAPAVLLVDGGDHSYYHDREDFDWATHIVQEAIPAARDRLDTNRAKEAIGGFSMGGFGALHLAGVRGWDAFCAVGAHSPALWHSAGATPEGAFDNEDAFEQIDILELAGEEGGRVFRGMRVWLDVGQEDPFRETTVELGRLIGRDVRVWPGDHSTGYWREHVDEYLRFYVDALRTCG